MRNWPEHRDDPIFWVLVVGMALSAFVLAAFCVLLWDGRHWTCVRDPRAPSNECVWWPRR